MIIGVTGAKGSGKDTFAEFFVRNDFLVRKMAGPLKDMLRSMYSHTGLTSSVIERKIEGDLKEESCPTLGGATPRWAMQSLGTEWAKMIDSTHTLWTRIWQDSVMNAVELGKPVVCTDIRFHHEVEALRELGGHLIRVVRPELTTTDNHQSETEMNELSVDYTVINDGTIYQLHREAEHIFEEVTSR